MRIISCHSVVQLKTVTWYVAELSSGIYILYAEYKGNNETEECFKEPARPEPPHTAGPVWFILLLASISLICRP